MSWIPYIVSILIAQGAGALGALFTTPQIPTWYAQLVKPSFNPPSGVFGPIWTALFALMGIAAAMIWVRRSKPGARQALWAYVIQLFLNVAWSAAFFGMQSPVAGMVIIAALLAAIVVTMVLFARISRMAALLLAPYLLWVCFASVLNYSLWQLN